MSDSNVESVDRLLAGLLLADAEQFLDGYPSDAAGESSNASDSDAVVRRWIWAKRWPLLTPVLRRLLPPLATEADVSDDTIAATITTSITTSRLPQLQAQIADANSTWSVDTLNQLDELLWAQSFLAPSPEWLSESDWRAAVSIDRVDSPSAMRSWIQTLILALDESQLTHPAVDAALGRYDDWLDALTLKWELPAWKQPASFAASSGEPLPPTRSLRWKGPKGKSSAVLEIPDTMPQNPVLILQFKGDDQLIEKAVMLGGLRGKIDANLQAMFDWDDVKLVQTQIQSLIVGSTTWEFQE